MIKNLIIFFSQYIKIRFFVNLKTELSARMYKSYMSKDLPFHIENDSSVLIRNIFIVLIIFLYSQIANSDISYKHLFTSYLFIISGLFIIAIGILIITGPTLLWFLYDNVGSLTDSTYGKLILIKIAIAAAMIGFGGMYQIKFLKNMNDLEKLNISRKISKPLKFEAG